MSRRLFLQRSGKNGKSHNIAQHMRLVEGCQARYIAAKDAHRRCLRAHLTCVSRRRAPRRDLEGQLAFTCGWDRTA
jgi:hypothetical protein